MRVRVARVKDLFHRLAFHDLGGFSKLNLLLIEDESMSENLGDAFELMMGGNDEMTTLSEFNE
jgi:hypothetical protein